MRGDIINHPHPSPLPPAGEGKIRTSLTGMVYREQAKLKSININHIIFHINNGMMGL